MELYLPPKDLLESWPVGPQNATLLGDRVFTEIIELKWGRQSECRPPGPVSLQREETSKQATYRKRTMWGWRQITVRFRRLRNARDWQQTTRSMRGLGQTASQPLEGTNPTDLLISNFQHQNRWVKQPSLWNFVAAALANDYRSVQCQISNVMRVLSSLYYLQSNPTAGHTHRGNQNWKRHMYPNVHRSTVYNSQDMETT